MLQKDRILALLMIGWLPIGAALGQQPRHANTIAIANELLRVAFEPDRGELRELVDLAAGRNQVGDGQQTGHLWELEVAAGGQRSVLTPAQAKVFRCELDARGRSRLRLTWRGLPLSQAGPCNVEVTVRLDGAEPVSRWEIAVEKPPGVGLRRVRFPRVFGLKRQTDERLAVPAWMGQELKNPRSLLCGANRPGRRLAWNYPGRLSMQCMAYYKNGGCGFYAACDDTAAMRKTFAFWGTPSGQVDCEVTHYPEAQATGASRYAIPYRVVLGTFQGDWITAAERYRAWAAKQPWATSSRRQRGLVPDWILQTGLWIWNRGRSPGVLPPAAALRKRLGLPVHVFWHWWHGCPYDIGFPEYLPPREGTDSFKRAVAQAHHDGVRMLIYMNQRAWGMSTRSWVEEDARRYAVKGEDGRVRPEVYNIFTKQALASMCLATPFWRNKYAGLAEQAFKELGVDGIYMDQACGYLPCYDPHHGHPLGGGNSWLPGFRALTAEIHRRCDAEGPIVLAGEGCGEAWLPYLDLMLTLQVSKERYSQPRDPWEVIPFFQAVYHRYAVTFGSYSSLVMPPYDELWPAEFAPEEPLALLDRKYSLQFYLEQARAFVWGQQPTLANFRPTLLEQRDREMRYVMRLARVRRRAAKYLLSGEFLRPPQLDVPQVTSDFSRLSIYAGQNSRLTSYQERLPLALAGAWRAADGSVAIALASIADEPLSLTLSLDRGYYGLTKHPGTASRIDEAGRCPLTLPGGEELFWKLELPPRAAWVIELPETTNKPIRSTSARPG